MNITGLCKNCQRLGQKDVYNSLVFGKDMWFHVASGIMACLWPGAPEYMQTTNFEPAPVELFSPIDGSFTTWVGN